MLRFDRPARAAVLCSALALCAAGTPAHAASARSAPAEPSYKLPKTDQLLLEDPLTSASPAKGEAAKKANGGVFTPKGWRAVKDGDFLMIELADARGFEGRLEIDLVDLDWSKANTAAGKDKIQFLGMFSNPRAELHVEGGGTNLDALWSLRGGTAPDGGPAFGNRFAVLQASRGAKRADPSDFEESVAPMAPNWKWDQSRYTFRIVWSKAAGQLLGYVNDRLMFHEPWENQVTPLKYIYIAKGPDFFTMIGPSFANLRVYAAVTEANANQTPAVSLIQPRNGAVFAAHESIELMADALDDGRIVKVEFFEGEKKIGEATKPPFSIKLPSAKEGWYAYSAKATDDRGAESKSHPKYVTVGTPWKPWGLTQSER